MSWRRRVASSFLTPATAAAARGQDGGGLVPAVLGAVGSDSQPTRSDDEDAGYTRVRAAPIRLDLWEFRLERDLYRTGLRFVLRRTEFGTENMVDGLKNPIRVMIRMVKVESEIVTFAVKNLGSKGDRSSSGENSLLETTSTGQKRRC
ncbi:hypothetical protein OROGR_016725 [Orobanche gracilis]